MATNWPLMGNQHANITEHGAPILVYLKYMQEKIKISNRIPTEQVEKIIRVSIEYSEATRCGPRLVQIWQKIESIESFAKEQCQKQNGINDKLTVLKEKQAVTIAYPKPQTWAAIVANAKTRPPLYNKNNKIVVKINDSASVEEIKKQTPDDLAPRIDVYLAENDITATKRRAAQTIPSGDIVIQRTNEEEAKKLREEEAEKLKEEEAEKLKEEDGWTKVLGSKAKLARKRYGIVALGIPIVKIDIEKPEETKEKIVMQNASIIARIKIVSIFWLSTSKKDRRT